MKMIGIVFAAAIGLGIVQWAAGGVEADSAAEAKAKIARCIEKEGWEYQAARDWIVLHPEALQAIAADSWQERWVKEICVAWPRNSSVYNKVMAGFRRAEYGASRADSVGVGDARREARQLARLYGDRLVPLMVECLWKTGRRWRGYKAWRTSAVVECLKLVGDSSILDPAIEVLVSGPRDAQEIPEPDSEEPSPVSGGMKALADLMDQMAPYRPVELILTFGDENTLAKLESAMESPDTGRASKDVLKRTIELLEERLERKSRGLPVGEVGPHDLYVELGDAATVECMRTVWGRGGGAFAQKMQQAAAELQTRIQRETREGTKVKLVQCVETEGEAYIEARNWLIKHPEALDLIDEDSWEHRWVKKICRAWVEHKDLYEKRMRGFELAERIAKGGMIRSVPSPLWWARNHSKFEGNKLVPLMVECLWKRGRNWRHLKAWRVMAVVEYLKLEGERSVVDPAIEVLESQSWDGKQEPDPGSEYPKMRLFEQATAHIVNQQSPYSPVELIVQFGDERTLEKLETLSVGAEISDTSKKVLRTATKLLEKRLSQKKQGEAVDEVDLVVEFGNHFTLESLKVRVHPRGYEPFQQRLRSRIAKLESRLERETREGAKVQLPQCVQKYGDEYMEAKKWLIEHPEALGLLDEDSWNQGWVKRICHAWIEHKDLYEHVAQGFEFAEMGSRGAVVTMVPDALLLARSRSRVYEDKLVPFMVECLWKTGRHWRRSKAWRIMSVVEYLKLEGDLSVLEPAIEVLASQSWDRDETWEPGSEYPRMDPGARAMADLIDQMAPYRPVELILTFGNESTLSELKSAMESPETSEASKQVLKKTTALLRQRLEAKRQGQAVEKVGPHDLYAEFGDATILENMRIAWGRGTDTSAQKMGRPAAEFAIPGQQEERHQAKEEFLQCIESLGNEYIDARDWLIEHPQALEFVGQASWKGQWVRRICQAWIEDRKLHEEVLGLFDLLENHARTKAAPVTPDYSYVLTNLARRHSQRLVPLMVECLWKTGRDWRRYKAWRVLAVVEYLRGVGGSSVVDPAIHVLASDSWGIGQAPDPEAEYPPMDPSHKAYAEVTDQICPYGPVELILQWGDWGTLRKMKTVADNPETCWASKQVLKRTTELLARRLERKIRGQAVEGVGPHDLYVEFGDATTLQNMNIIAGGGSTSFKQEIRQGITDLEKRLEKEKKSEK